MVDVFKDVNVNVLGTTVKVRPVVSKQIMDYTLKARGDKNYMFTSELDIKFDLANKKVTVQAMKSAKDTYAVTDKDELLKWDENGVFYVDSGLFNITYDELCKKLNVKLPELTKWTYWGNNLYWTYSDDLGDAAVIFMFYRGKVKHIYSEKEGTMTNNFINSLKNRYGAKFVYDDIPAVFYGGGLMANGGTCWVTVSDNFYDNKHHINQRFEYYNP